MLCMATRGPSVIGPRNGTEKSPRYGHTFHRKLTPETMNMMLMLLLGMLMLNGAFGHSTCSAVAMNQNGSGSATTVSVTCDFRKNISQKDFSALFLDFYHGPGCEEFEVALLCNRRNNESLVCKKRTGVVFDENQMVVDQLKFTISSSCMTPGTQFVCQTVQEEGAEPCNVTYEDDNGGTASTTAVRDGYSMSPNLHMSSEVPSSSSPLEVATFVILLIFIFAVIVALVVCYIFRKRIRKWCLGPIGDRWPGVLENPPNPEEPPEENSSQTSPMLTGEASVPEGLPRYFYDLGREAAKTRGKKEKKEERENPGSGLNDDITVEVKDPGEHGKSKSKKRKEEKSPGKEKERESSGGCHVM